MRQIGNREFSGNSEKGLPLPTKHTWNLMSKILFDNSWVLFLFLTIYGNSSQERLRSSGTGSAITQGVGDTLRVLSYNIHHANPPSEAGKIDMKAIARVITESEADLIALQEVDVYTERSGKKLHQAEELGRLTGMHAYFYKSIDHQGGEYGNAILSRYPLLEKNGFELPYEEGTEPRTVLYVTVVTPQGRQVTFAGTHLDFKSEANTYQQAKYLTEYFLSKDISPLILAGDLNTVSGESPIQYLDLHFQRSCLEDCPPTSPQINPKKEIDFVMFRPGASLKLISHEVIDEPFASDHLPVLVTLEVAPMK